MVGHMHGTAARMRSVEQIIEAIDTAYEANAKTGRQIRLRASSLGKECLRALVFDFWWATDPQPVKGRIQRIFATGERIESEIISDLKRAGFEVVERDPANPTKQLSVNALHGHLFGYVDAVGRDREAGGDWLIIEVKSHNKNSFAKLLKAGCEATKPEHAAQLTIYMKLTDTPRGLYVAKCKDDEQIYMEVFELNESYASRLIERALAILDRKVLPARIASLPTHYKCRFCDHVDVCHNGRPFARNCRTCNHIVAIEGGEFACKKHECIIEKTLAETGCGEYQLASVFES